MRKVKLLGLAALALFAFGAFAASSAFAVEAEEENNPRILCLVAPCAPLEGTLKGGASSLIGLNGKTLEGTGSELKLKNCENVAGNEKDISLCKEVPIAFTGVKEGKVACRSENNKGEKDPIETVLSLLDLHMAAELTAAKVLQPLITAAVLGTAKEEELKLTCGVVKIKITNGQEKPKDGVIACLLLPGLANIPITTEVEVLCKVNAATHDPETGTCNVLCEDFGPIGLSATLGGGAATDSWESIHLKGKLNKDIFIDD